MEIDKGIPAPSISSAGRPMKYPWNLMEVGDSVFFDGPFVRDTAKQVVASHTWGKRHGVKFVSKREGTGVRIWRVE